MNSDLPHGRVFWRGIALGLAFAAVLGFAASQAIDVFAAAGSPMDMPGPGMHHHSLLHQLQHLKAKLKLNSQQAALWDEAEQKTQPSEEERKQMRAQHARWLAALADPGFDPHPWAAEMDQARAARMSHMKDVQDAWLAVWDTLDTDQRTQARGFLHARAAHMGMHWKKHMPEAHEPNAPASSSGTDSGVSAPVSKP